MIENAVTSFSYKRVAEEKMAIGNIETRHSLRSACSLPHGSRTPARGGYGNTSTLATLTTFDCRAMPNPYWDESLRVKEFCVEKWYNMSMHRREEP